MSDTEMRERLLASAYETLTAARCPTDYAIQLAMAKVALAAEIRKGVDSVGY